MLLNENVVVAEFDGGRVILVIDNPHKRKGEMYARDLHGNFDYLVIANGSDEFTDFGYSLSMAYFEVARTGRLESLINDHTLMKKYHLSYGDEIDDMLLLEIEDEMARIDGNKPYETRPTRR